MSEHVCCGCHDSQVNALLKKSQDRELDVRNALRRIANGCWSGPASVLDATLKGKLDEAESELASATDLANSWAREMGISESPDVYGLKQLIDRLWTACTLRMYVTGETCPVCGQGVAS